MIDRRRFFSSAFSAAFAGLSAKAEAAPLKIAHRQANMVQPPGPQIFDFARRIPGLSGVELQVFFKEQTLWDPENMSAYKREARRVGLLIPSLAGIWPPHASLVQAGPARECISKAIRAAEDLGSRVILAAAFDANCPRMDDEASYGPVVTVLQSVAQAAADAGVTIGLETSLAPEDDKKLIDLVARKSVKVYYDLFNVETRHPGQAVPGIRVLGKARIAQCHLKNEDRLLEQPGPVDWAAALKGLHEIGYDGWYVFETSHSTPEQCIAATVKNIDFIRRHSA
jgi:sugar phosphate isomerase/epimerase